MRSLFVKVKLFSTGADLCDNSNFEILKNISIESYCYELTVNPSIFYRVLSSLKGDYYGVGNQMNEIDRIIKINNIDTIFIASSLLGNVSRFISCRYPSIKVISFFHNVEYIYALERFKIEEGKLKNWMLAKMAFLSEKYTCGYSNFLFALNDRDAKQIQNIYKRSPDYLLPISIEDKFKRLKYSSESKCLKLLFVGSNFFANREGITWFIKNVIPSISNSLLTVVGKGFDSSINPDNLNNVIVKGFVNNLYDEYENADVVVAPIFSGSGMKTKVAEALMMAKPVIGTKEAFTGYNTNSSALLLCNNKFDFIHSINELSSNLPRLEEMSADARNTYLKNYSISIQTRRLSEFFHQ